MLASAFGAVVAVTLGSYVSDHPIALILWGLIGAFVGFVSVGPRQFVIEWQKKYCVYMVQWKTKKAQRMSQRKEDDALLREHSEYVEMMRLKAMYRSATSVGIYFWLNLVLIFFQIKLTLLDLVFASLVALTVTHLLWFITGGLNDDVTLVRIIREMGGVTITKNLSGTSLSLRHSKIVFLKVVFWPAWLLVWCVINPKFLLGCLLTITHNTCKLVASLGRYSAMFGAVAGFAGGWMYGRDIKLAGLVGAIAGGGIYLVAISTELLLHLFPQEILGKAPRPVMSV